MRKLLFLIFALFITIVSNAQIKIEQTFTNDLIIIGNISSGKAWNAVAAAGGNYNTSRLAEHKLYCRIFGEKTTYGILVDTENRFDDDFEFALGTDMGKAKESINQLLQFMADKPLKTSITVKDEDERTIQINLKSRKTISLQVVDAQGITVVNDVYLSTSNLERALKLLDKKAEAKVNETIKRNNQ